MIDLNLGVAQQHIHLGWLVMLCGLMISAWVSTRLVKRLPKPKRQPSDHVVPSTAQIAPLVAAANPLANWAAYGGVHFLGTGTYTAETPEEAEKLYNDLVAATGGKKRKRRFDPEMGMV
jgi:hypothetical protein